MATDMEKHGWGPGWPNCQSSKMKTLARPDGLRVVLHQDLIPLFAFLMDETERLGYDLTPGECWGFACRSVRGSRTVGSNHSNGGALDINAPHNPMGSRLITNIPMRVVMLWEAHMFRWGGRYIRRPDAMHMEFWGTPADAKRIIGGLKPGSDQPAPVQALRDNELPLVLHRGPKFGDPYTHSYLVSIYQTLINEWIVQYKPKQVPGLKLLEVDGAYGPTSGKYTTYWKQWMIQFQRDFGLSRWPDTSTYVGPLTFGALQKFTAL